MLLWISLFLGVLMKKWSYRLMLVRSQVGMICPLSLSPIFSPPRQDPPVGCREVSRCGVSRTELPVGGAVTIRFFNWNWWYRLELICPVQQFGIEEWQVWSPQTVTWSYASHLFLFLKGVQICRASHPYPQQVLQQGQGSIDFWIDMVTWWR